MSNVLPLKGRCVLVTRPPDRSDALARELSALGAVVLHAPTIIIQPIADYARVDEAISNIERYDWLVLTSSNGIRALAARAGMLGVDSMQLARVCIAVNSPRSAELLTVLGQSAALVPPAPDAESLAAELLNQGIKGKRCLLLRSAGAINTLPKLLSDAGAMCDDLPIYRITAPPSLPQTALDRMRDGAVDWATFTSPSTFSNLLRLLADRTELVSRMRLAAIGPTTAQAIRDAGYKATVTADHPTDSALARAIGEYEHAHPREKPDLTPRRSP